MIRWLIARLVVLVIPLRFDAAQADGVEATLELRIGIRGRVSCFTVTIAEGRCTALLAAASNPDARASVSLANLIRMSLGDVAWPQLLSRGQFELTGDPFLALRLPALFGMAPRPGRPSSRVRAGTVRG